MHPTITLLDGSVYFIEGTQLPSRAGLYQVKEYVKSSFLVGIDLSTGKETFRQPVQSKSRHNIFMAGSKGRLVLVGTFNIKERYPGIHRASNGILVYELKCFNINSKKWLWQKEHLPKLKGGKGHGEGDRRPVIIDETLYCDPFAYEISTGELYESFAWKTVKRKGCGQNSKIVIPNIHM